MSLSRLRLGEWLALIGALGLLVTLFLDWFGLTATVHVIGGGREQSGWAGLGWVIGVLLAVTIAGGVATALTTALRQTPAWSVSAAVLTAPLGAVVFVVLLLRIVLFQPDLGAGLPNALVDVNAVAYLGLLFCALIPIGAFLALRDERTGAPESAYTPPPPRPVPGT
jgi:hypothetical protein